MLQFSNINKFKNYNEETGYLFLENEYNGDLDKKVLPKGIKEIEFDLKTLLNLNASFNRLIDYLPDTLEKLSLSAGFNQEIEKLPKNLIYLSFRNGYYNQPIDNIIFPDNLKTIIFGSEFNQSIDALPDTIEHITLGIRFKQKINKYPKSLKSLENDNNTKLENLPETLEKLTLGYYYNRPIDNLPDKLKELIIIDYKDCFTKFSKELKVLTISRLNKKIGCYNFQENKLMLPEGITHLTLDAGFNQEVDDLPNSLIYLKLGNEFNQSLDNLPLGIEELELGRNYNKIANNLPSSLQKIIIINENQMKLFPKLPFGCKIEVKPRIQEEIHHISMSMFKFH